MHDLGQMRPYHANIASPHVPAFSGSQFRMSELTAAVALAQLRKVDGIRAHCRRLYTRIFFFQAEDGIRDLTVTGVQTCALPISPPRLRRSPAPRSRPTQRDGGGSVGLSLFDSSSESVKSCRSSSRSSREFSASSS